ncbi:MAG TPA: hypothetical protein VKW70_11000, partial [Terriglobia bacterium]|nr:hypothetical protein [Terriglobia bacterium]
DGCIHRVAASPQNFKPRFRGERLAGYDHPVLRGYGIIGPPQGSRGRGGDEKYTNKEGLVGAVAPKISLDGF